MPLSDKPVLADAAHILSDQLRTQLKRLARIVAPQAPGLERKFLAQLKKLKYEPLPSRTLAEITFGSAASLLGSRKTIQHFFEQVSVAGRRLAKLNVPPGDVLQALAHYDELLEPLLSRLRPDEQANARWVRDQIHFCVVLSLNNAYYQVREAETQAFQQIMAVELESCDISTIYERFLTAMAEMCHAKAARLYLSNGDDSALTLSAAVPENGNGSAAKVELRGSVRKSLSRPLHVQRAQQSRLVMEPSWPRSYTSIWSVPIQRQGVLAGLMQFGFDQHQEWLPRELQLFTAAAERCLLAADRARLIQNLAARELQVRELAEHMLHVEEMERRRISRELHDEAGQSLVCIRLQLELAEGDLPPELTEVRVKLGEVRDLTEKTILDIRRLISDLSPAVLEQLGLGAAVRQLVNRFQKSYPCVVRLNVGTLTDVPQKIQIVTYRLVQECCNNIAKHSAATNVNISLVSADGLLKLSVQDNGVGFEVQEAFAKHKSFGLSGMRERVALLGGRFEVRSDPAGGRKQHRGTEISIDLPIPA